MNEIVSELRKIEEKNGFLTPRAVVEEAQSKTSPLHKLFDWQDYSAAAKYRIWQARQLISTVKVTIEGERVDAFHNVTVSIDNVKTQGYMNTEKVINDEQLYNQVIKSAIREIEYWNKKYAEIKELEGLVNSEMLNKLKDEA